MTIDGFVADTKAMVRTEHAADLLRAPALADHLSNVVPMKFGELGATARSAAATVGLGLSDFSTVVIVIVFTVAGEFAVDGAR